MRPPRCIRGLSTSASCWQTGPTISAPSTAAASDQDAAALGRFFYRNRMVNKWGGIPARRTTLQQLIMFGRSTQRNQALLMESANYLRTEMTTRIAHRLRDMQTLPFVAMSNEQLDSIYQFYWRTFETMRRMSKIETDEQNEELIHVVTQLLSERKSKLDLIAGISRECINFMEPAAVNYFLARMLRSQVSREVLAKQHIALSVMQSSGVKSTTPNVIGMINTSIHVADVIRRCTDFARKSLSNTYDLSMDDPRLPEVVLEGDLDVQMAYLPAHLEFILLELFKVSMQSTTQKHGQVRQKVPPVHVRLVSGIEKGDMIIRISDVGGGLLLDSTASSMAFESSSNNAIRARGPLLLPGIARHPHDTDPEQDLVWSFLNIGKQLDMMNIKLDATSSATLGKTGIDGAVTPDPTASYPGGDGLMRLSVLNMDSKNGLPIVKLYAELFGGGLDFRSLNGYGTDIYLRLPKLGTSKELHE
ncbi:putative protein kinase Pkp2 [Malassezia pachydermatis]